MRNTTEFLLFFLGVSMLIAAIYIGINLLAGDSHLQTEHQRQELVASNYCGREIGDEFVVDDPGTAETSLVLVSRLEGGLVTDRVGSKYTRKKHIVITVCPGEVFAYKDDLKVKDEL